MFVSFVFGQSIITLPSPVFFLAMPQTSLSNAFYRPYRDPVLITAQALSIVGLCLTWTTWWNIVFTLVGFVLLQVAWCCKLNKCGLITAGVFCCLSGVISVVTGVLISVTFSNNCYGSSVNFNDDFYVDDETSAGANYGNGDIFCTASTAISVLVYIAAVVMLLAGVLTFVFSCGSRIDRYNRENDIGMQKDDDPVVKATEVKNHGDKDPSDRASNTDHKA